MSAFTESKLNSDLVSKAVSALLKYEAKKAGQGSKDKALLMSNYAKPILVQVANALLPLCSNKANKLSLHTGPTL